VFNLVIPCMCRSDYCFGCSGTSTSWYITLKRTLTTHKMYGHYHRRSKTSDIPIKLTDADQILHISVTDLSLTPPTSSDKIIQPKDIRSMNDTTHNLRASTSTCRGSDTRQSFSDDHSFEMEIIHMCGYILPIKRVANRMPIIVLHESLSRRQ
jgi:hypothetical protein